MNRHLLNHHFQGDGRRLANYCTTCLHLPEVLRHCCTTKEVDEKSCLIVVLCSLQGVGLIAPSTCFARTLKAFNVLAYTLSTSTSLQTAEASFRWVSIRALKVSSGGDSEASLLEILLVSLFPQPEQRSHLLSEVFQLHAGLNLPVRPVDGDTAPPPSKSLCL